MKSLINDETLKKACDIVEFSAIAHSKGIAEAMEANLKILQGDYYSFKIIIYPNHYEIHGINKKTEINTIIPFEFSSVFKKDNTDNEKTD